MGKFSCKIHCMKGNQAAYRVASKSQKRIDYYLVPGHSLCPTIVAQIIGTLGAKQLILGRITWTIYNFSTLGWATRKCVLFAM